MKKSIRLSLELYELMAAYIYDHYDADDRARYLKIDAGIKEKYNAALRHEYYKIYKTDSSADTREWARQEYLDAAGVHPDWRWDKISER